MRSLPLVLLLAGCIARTPAADPGAPDVAVAPPGGSQPDAAPPEAGAPDLDAGPLDADPRDVGPVDASARDADPSDSAMNLGCRPGGDLEAIEPGALEQRALTAGPDGLLVWIEQADRARWAWPDGRLGPPVPVGGRAVATALDPSAEWLLVRSEAEGDATLTAIHLGRVEIRRLPSVLGGFASPGPGVVVGVGTEGAFLADLERDTLVHLPGSSPCEGGCMVPVLANDGAIYYDPGPSPDAWEVAVYHDGARREGPRLARLLAAAGVVIALGPLPGRDCVDCGSLAPVWRLAAGQRDEVGVIHVDAIDTASLSPDGAHLAHRDPETRELRILSTDGGPVPPRLPHTRAETPIWLSPTTLMAPRVIGCWDDEEAEGLCDTPTWTILDLGAAPDPVDLWSDQLGPPRRAPDGWAVAGALNGAGLGLEAAWSSERRARHMGLQPELIGDALRLEPAPQPAEVAVVRGDGRLVLADFEADAARRLSDQPVDEMFWHGTTLIWTEDRTLWVRPRGLEPVRVIGGVHTWAVLQRPGCASLALAICPELVGERCEGSPGLWRFALGPPAQP